MPANRAWPGKSDSLTMSNGPYAARTMNPASPGYAGLTMHII